MKKMTLLFSLLSLLLCNSPAQAQNAGGNAARGAGARAGRTMASDAFAWGACVGSIALVGTVVGLTVNAATSSSSSFGH